MERGNSMPTWVIVAGSILAGVVVACICLAVLVTVFVGPPPVLP